VFLEPVPELYAEPVLLAEPEVFVPEPEVVPEPVVLVEPLLELYIEEPPVAEYYDTDHRDKLVHFNVSRVWKGKAPQPGGTMAVQTGPYSAMCGIEFNVGETWMVYTRGDGTAEGAYSCDRSSRKDPDYPTGEAYTDAKELGDASLRNYDGACLESAYPICAGGASAIPDPSRGCVAPDCEDIHVISTVPFTGGPLWADIDGDGVLTDNGLDYKFADVAIQITDALGERHVAHTGENGTYQALIHAGEAKVKIGMMTLPAVATKGKVWKQSESTTNPMTVQVYDDNVRRNRKDRRHLQDDPTTVVFEEATCSDLTSCSACLSTFPACAWSNGQCVDDSCDDAALPCRQIPFPYEGMATPEDICAGNTGTCVDDSDCALEEYGCNGCNCRGTLKAVHRGDDSCEPDMMGCLALGCANMVSQCLLGACVAVDEVILIEESPGENLNDQVTDPNGDGSETLEESLLDVGTLRTAEQQRGYACQC